MRIPQNFMIEEKLDSLIMNKEKDKEKRKNITRILKYSV